MATTFAFRNVVGSFTDPDVGTFTFKGQIGLKHITIKNATERGVLDTASDGGIMISYVAGASGGADIVMQQTSSFDEYLNNWANTKFTNAENGNADNFGAAAIKVTDTLSGKTKTLTGVFPTKIPDYPVGNTGADITWAILAAKSRRHPVCAEVPRVCATREYPCGPWFN